MLNGKVAVVTGGTRGIGLAIVKKYLDNGATVVLCGSREETAKNAVKKLKNEKPEYKVEGISPKLNSPEEIKAAFETIRSNHGRIDILDTVKQLTLHMDNGKKVDFFMTNGDVNIGSFPIKLSGKFY